MGKYKAKKVGRWTERNMDEALAAVRGCMSLKEAARQFKIPYTTLQNRHMECMDPAKARKQKRAGGHSVFNDEQEIELKNRIIKLAQFGHGKRSPSKDVQIGFPNGTKVITTESGWITEDAFLLWLKHFERFRAPGPSVLVLDGHISHKSLRALEFCEKKQIHDEGPRKISKVTFGGILKTAWCKAATPGIAESGFRTTGIYPFNPDVMQEHEYLPTLSSSAAPSTVTYNEDLSLPSHVSQQISESAEISSMTPTAGASIWSDCNTRTVETPRHTTHKSFKSMTSESEVSPTQSVVSFRDVLPSPAKEKGVFSTKLKEEPKNLVGKKEEQPERNHKLKSLICRKLVVSSDDEDDSIEMKTTSHVRDENVCQFCFLAYDDPRSVKKGDWIRCQGAQKEWYHEICVGAQGRKQFVCGKCM
ncbi:hypothetical protein ANN_16415 [Periplaneta americana]|uniref:HTH psq-type domain-containing protein n=1 Tax=Periplaneta americana TaxID=6978 RepID=A0ABQ8SIX2_PERAM|nr:hypothetical protein ANN_16415 [Periplaneta americana]